MACGKFKTQFEPPEVIPVASGSPMDNVYQFVIDENTGRQELRKTGETNRYQIIQAHYESTKIENILARATLDPSVLADKGAMYGDFSEMPTSLMDAQIKIMGIKNEFEQLPNDIRQKFGYSLGEYVKAYGTESWAQALGLTQEETHDIKQTTEAIAEAVEQKGAEE